MLDSTYLSYLSLYIPMYLYLSISISIYLYVSISIQGRSSRCLHYMIRLFGKTRFIMKHCATDWLLGTWIIFWGTLLATIMTLFYCIYSISHGDSRLSIFVNVTGFIDCVWFLLGAVYFVSGSFSSGADEEDDDDIYTTPTSRSRPGLGSGGGMYGQARQVEEDDTIEISLLPNIKYI